MSISETERFVILLEFVDGRRDISELIFNSRHEAEIHALQLENTDEVLFAMIRRASLV